MKGKTGGRALAASRFIMGFGLVSMLMDVVYEGALSVQGPLLASLGATAATVGLISGLGEATSLMGRLVTGPLADRVGRYWLFAIAGYAITALAVPAMGLAGSVAAVGALVVLERMGKAVRTPSRDAMISHASAAVGRGKGFALHELMDQIAFVFQNSRLFKTSIYENVRSSRPDATREEVLAALISAQCKDILEKLPQGMDTVIGTEGTYVSGGEQQRIALARAILKDAPIVVLDEATAFADPENEALIQKGFTKLMKGRTVIMIAHRLSTVVGADKIIVLNEGKIVEQGRHQDLVKADGLYAKMWADYNKAIKWKITAQKEVA